jgi:hypothetical protein
MCLCLMALVVFGLSCSDSPDQGTLQQNITKAKPAKVENSTLSYDNVARNNGPEYWEGYEIDPYEESYDDLVPSNEDKPLKLVQMAADSDKRFEESSDKNASVSELQSAYSFYVRAALKDDQYVPKATDRLESAVAYKAKPDDLAENTLALMAKYPDLMVLKSLLPKIQTLLLEDLKKVQDFNSSKAYQTQDSWETVYGDGVYAISDIDFLGRIAKATGDKKGYAKWQRYIAEYEMNGHTFDGVHEESSPSISYRIYNQLGDVSSAKKAAMKEGEVYLKVYLLGGLDAWGRRDRDPGLQYDLDQAKVWYAKAGLSGKKLDDAMFDFAENLHEQLPDCVGIKDCSKEDTDDEKRVADFLDRLS